MRIDHVAYQQGTRVAGYGLLLQIVIGLVLLLFGAVGRDTAFLVAASYALTGVLPWLSLVVIFHQHKLERLESLEADELAQTRGTTIFDREVEATRVAARRLQIMHSWLMPIVSILTAALLAGLGFWIVRWFQAQNDPESAVSVFQVTDRLGWAMAIALSLALISFIFSRFVAGMAKQPAWQNLRAGAGFMVGSALICVATAVGFGFQFAQKQAVLENVCFGIAIFMIAQAVEILLNLVLNLYRPRRAGEAPRPALDSRVLSLLSAPDSIVRSINEAVNYQFGFDITSSWGYQLLLRSIGRLAGVGVLIMILLSCVATIEPDQRGVRLRFGALREIHGPGLMFKLPWPVETVEVHQVGRVRQLALSINPLPPGQRPPPAQRVNNWINEDPAATDRKLFVTGASRLGSADPRTKEIASDASRGAGALEASDEKVGDQFSLVDAEVVLLYRVRPDGVRAFLEFASDSIGRRSTQTMRERAMRVLALRETTEHFARLPLEDVLSPALGILDALRRRVQARFDDPSNNAGVEVVAVTINQLRPPADAAPMFEEYSISVQARRQQQELAQRVADVTMAVLAKSSETVDRIVARIDEYNAFTKANKPVEAAAAKLDIERLLVTARGQAAGQVEQAEAWRWRTQMDARRDANRLAGDLPMFEAAPELYRQWQIMRVLRQSLPGARIKYMLGIDPSRVEFDVEMQEVDSGLNFLDNVEKNPNKADEGGS